MWNENFVLRDRPRCPAGAAVALLGDFLNYNHELLS